MRAAHTVEQVRAAEASLIARLPAGALMQRAAAGLATAIAGYLRGPPGLGTVYGARIVLLVGSGDNGGDALYAGARLARRGAAVSAVLLSPNAHPAGLAALRSAGGRIHPHASRPPAPVIAAADVVVDGIVGLGGRPGISPAAAAVAELVERHGIPVVAVDVPSGVEVDTGATPGRQLAAELTVTFGTYKICHLVDPAAAAAGSVHLVDLGLELPRPAVEALQPADVAARYPVPGPGSDKYSRGVAGLMVGSAKYPGAAVLAVAGGLGGPLGVIRYVGPDPVAAEVRAAHPEVVAGPGRVQAWVIGSGLGDDADPAPIGRLIEAGEPLVIDADGLRHLPDRFGKPVLLTPHAGELSRLLGVSREAVEARRLEHAREAASRFNATVLLKGSTTVVAAPDGRVRVNTRATSWLATAGSGDVLAGLCGALLAAGLEPLDAGSVGAFLHAAAARLAAGGGPITAGEVAARLPEATRLVLAGGQPNR